ncbi:unnamed protein product [Trifolium pratense]|uniref:Uncharacterized protein n=1 Tax=Trifolium pratense TaxID=57577 RepID=A0ACB0IYI6_TRIPR|nr:unnamed protein product [Trifolium pratense]
MDLNFSRKTTNWNRPPVLSTTNNFQASCCSSNGSVEITEEMIKSLDLEVERAQVEMSTCNYREEKTRRWE